MPISNDTEIAAAPPTVQSAATTGTYLVFDLGGQQYATPVSHVREVLTLPRITPVPGRMASVEGVIDLRGLSVPVLELAKLLGIDPAPHGDATRVIVCDVPDPAGWRVVSLIVDRVDQVVQLGEEQIEHPPADDIVDPTAVLGIARIGGDTLTVVLDIVSLLARPARAETVR